MRWRQDTTKLTAKLGLVLKGIDPGTRGTMAAIALHPFDMPFADHATGPCKKSKSEWHTLCDGDHKSTSDSRKGMGVNLALAVMILV